MDRREKNQAKIYGLRRSLPFPASALVLDAYLVVAGRPHGARLGLAVAIGVVMATWLIGSWRSIKFTRRHLTDSEQFWQAYLHRSRTRSLRVAATVLAVAVAIEAIALDRSAWLLATALLGPIVIALFILAALADQSRTRA